MGCDREVVSRDLGREKTIDGEAMGYSRAVREQSGSRFRTKGVSAVVSNRKQIHQRAWRGAAVQVARRFFSLFHPSCVRISGYGESNFGEYLCQRILSSHVETANLEEERNPSVRSNSEQLCGFPTYIYDVHVRIWSAEGAYVFSKTGCRSKAA